MTSRAVRLTGVLAPARDAGATDAELLDRFVAHHDESAFAALVARHGPMVFGVCRRALRDWHAAEDAVQAVFLVLVRKAGAVSPPHALAGWLYGVARRVAQDARRAELRRATRERRADGIPDPAAPPPPDADRLAVLDEELCRLPRKYRDLLVACDLAGRPRAPVAASLGIPEGTLSSRLTAARKMLAARLRGRGFAPAAAALALVHAREAVAAPAGIAARVASVALSPTAHATISALATGAIRAMSGPTLETVAATVVLAAVAVACAVMPSSAGPVPPARAAAPPPPVPAPGKAAVDTGRLLVGRTPGRLSLVSADGKTETAAFDTPRNSVVAARLSKDGTRAACNELTATGGRDQFGKAGNTAITLRDVGKGTSDEIDVRGQYACWSADDTRLVVVEAEQGNDRVQRTNWVYDLGRKEKQKFAAADTDAVRDWAPDEKFFLAVRREKVNGKPVASAVLLDKDGKFVRKLAEVDGDVLDARLSPTGTTVAVIAPAATTAGAPARNVLLVTDVKTPKPVALKDLPLNGSVTSCCWSPDGNRIAYTWQQVFEKNADATECESVLVICDPDGTNAKTVTTEKATGPGAAVRRGLGVYDWKPTPRGPKP